MRLYAVSRDSHHSHRAWKQALDVDLEFLSDWNGTLAKRFGVSRLYRWMANVPERSAFLLAADGTVRGSWRYGDSDVPDVDELLAAAQASFSSR